MTNYRPKPKLSNLGTIYHFEKLNKFKEVRIIKYYDSYKLQLRQGEVGQESTRKFRTACEDYYLGSIKSYFNYHLTEIYDNAFVFIKEYSGAELSTPISDAPPQEIDIIGFTKQLHKRTLKFSNNVMKPWTIRS